MRRVSENSEGGCKEEYGESTCVEAERAVRAAVRKGAAESGVWSV